MNKMAIPSLPTTTKEFARWSLAFFGLLLAEQLTGVVSMWLKEPVQIESPLWLTLVMFVASFAVFAWLDGKQRERHLDEQRGVAAEAANGKPPAPNKGEGNNNNAKRGNESAQE